MVSNVNKKAPKYVALDFILSRFPAAVRELSSLLVHFGIIPKLPDFQLNDVTSRMTNALKLTKAIEFMAAALEIATEFIRKGSNGLPIASIVFIM